jgi:NADH:ubiquinone oxidoreductase subunit K
MIYVAVGLALMVAWLRTVERQDVTELTAIRADRVDGA